MKFAHGVVRSACGAAIVGIAIVYAAGASAESRAQIVTSQVAPARILAHPQPQSRASLPKTRQTLRAAASGSHIVFGTIAALHGTDVALRLRSGRLFAVDASAVIANGDYSAPLFVGKIVGIDGNERNSVFLASHIFALENLSGLRADR